MKLNSTNRLFEGKSSIGRMWRHSIVALLLLLALTMFLYGETGIAMVGIWARSETFTHAFLVPPISLWLIWRRRNALATQAPQPNWWVLLVVSATSFLWLLGDLVAVNAVTQLALVSLLVLAVPAVLGLAVTRKIIFPLGFLFFSVPIGEFVMPQLMEWTADFTVLALRLSGVPVFREGLQFVIPSGNWSVVEACSGVRYLIASLTVGTLFAYLNYQSTSRRVLFVIVSILVPVVANWLRAYMIVMLGHLSGNTLAVGVDHLIYGWVFFGVVIMLMFFIGARWAEPEPSEDAGAAGSSAKIAAPGVARLWLAAASCAAIVAMPHIALWQINQSEGSEVVALGVPTELAANWKSTPALPANFKPAFQDPSAEFNGGFVNEGHQVGLYIGYYRQQSYSRKLVSSSNVLVASKDPQWALVDSGSRSVTLAGNPVALRTAELRGSAMASSYHADRLVAWQIYWINGRWTANDYMAKVYSAYYRLIGRGDDSAVIVVYTLKTSAVDAESVLESFLSTYETVLSQLLQQAQQSQ